ncbi:MAG TPA: hypothetical protein VGK90_10275 [Rhizomicrobium sp.]
MQYVLSRHDGSIILYPGVGLWSDGSHHNLVLNFFGNYQRPDVVRDDPARLLAELGRQARVSNSDVVISSEILSGHRDISEFVAAVRAAIGEECRVVVIATVREHRERVASLYNQRIKDAVIGETREPDVFLVDNPERFCYASLLRRLMRTGFELVVLNYHPAEDFAARCLGLFGFTPGDVPLIPRRNVSLGRVALIATLAANRAAESREDRALFDAALSRIVNRFANGDVLFGKTAIRAVRNLFIADRKFVQQQFGVDIPRPEKAVSTKPFVISEREFDALNATMRELGDHGARTREHLRGFVTVAEPVS